MKVKYIFKLSLKYLLGYKRRFLFLFAVLSFGFCIVTVIISQKDGMSEAVYNSAQGHYAGDIVFSGYDAESEFTRHINNSTVKIINNEINNSKINIDRIVYRTLYHIYNIYFNGDSLELKNLVGVDWENEAEYFNKLSYVTEKINTKELDENSIVISSPVAERFGINVGDSVILEFENGLNQKDTSVFIVGAIIKDTSIFGYYKSFIDRKKLNSMMNFDIDECSMIGLFLKEKQKTEKVRKLLQENLLDKITLIKLVYSREEWEEIRYKNKYETAILTIQVYISEITEILQAVSLLSLFLYVMMLLIILVSAGVTYRLILHERIKEIATMRALGGEESTVRAVLLLEAIMLTGAALIFGFALSLFINWCMSFVSFDWMPSFEIFLTNGRLSPIHKLPSLLINIAAVYIVIILAVYFPVFRTTGGSLPKMLSGGGVKE
ncbi:MAG: hypothetical protein Ta2G_11850 [Termitinemataceae bacterium]|nr:MAG: hypothetical protein Ta2G_11850 [Termitinemataceae bacterium]